MHDNGSYQMDIPELRDAFIVIQSMVGCSSKMDGSAFFIHPFDRIKIKLPSYPCKEEFESISFSSPPTSTNCFVIAIISHGDKFSIIRRGEVAWTLCEFTEHFQPIGNENPVLYKDRCYWLGLQEDGLPAEVGVFDPREYLTHPNLYNCRWKFFSILLL